MMTEVKLVPKTTAVTEQKSQARNQNFMSFMDESEPLEQTALVSVDLEMQQYLNDQASNENPLLFWNDHKESFPRLYQISPVEFYLLQRTLLVLKAFSVLLEYYSVIEISALLIQILRTGFFAV